MEAPDDLLELISFMIPKGSYVSFATTCKAFNKLSNRYIKSIRKAKSHGHCKCGKRMKEKKEKKDPAILFNYIKRMLPYQPWILEHLKNKIDHLPKALVLANPDFPWDWNTLSWDDRFTKEEVIANQHLPWNWEGIANDRKMQIPKDILYLHIPKSDRALLKAKCGFWFITWRYIIDHITKYQWDWEGMYNMLIHPPKRHIEFLIKYGLDINYYIEEEGFDSSNDEFSDYPSDGNYDIEEYVPRVYTSSSEETSTLSSDSL